MYHDYHHLRSALLIYWPTWPTPFSRHRFRWWGTQSCSLLRCPSMVDASRFGLPSMWFTSSDAYADLSLWRCPQRRVGHSKKKLPPNPRGLLWCSLLKWQFCCTIIHDDPISRQTARQGSTTPKGIRVGGRREDMGLTSTSEICEGKT